MKKIVIMICSIVLIMPIFGYALEINDEEELVKFEKCVDGDTAIFRDKNENIKKVRFLAVDTPETVHPTKGVQPFGKKASEYTCETLKNAKEIKLEYDPNSSKQDKYGRELAWVFVDGILIQESLVSQGYAEVTYLYGNYKYTALLKDIQETAKVQKLGIWSISEEERKQDTSVVNNVKDDLNKTVTEKLIDNVIASIGKFIDDLLEIILKSIEDML